MVLIVLGTFDTFHGRVVSFLVATNDRLQQRASGVGLRGGGCVRMFTSRDHLCDR